MFERVIKELNRRGIIDTANMLLETFPEIEKNLKEYAPRKEVIYDGFVSVTKIVPEDCFGTISFVLRYYPKVIASGDFDKLNWLLFLCYQNGKFEVHNNSKSWNELSEIIEIGLIKKDDVYELEETEFDEFDRETCGYHIGSEPIARTPESNPFYNGLIYDGLMRTRYIDVSAKDEQIIQKMHIKLDTYTDEYVDFGLIEDFIFKRDALYEALLYEKADWEYNRIITGHFVELIQGILKMQYPLIDGTKDLTDLGIHNNCIATAWDHMIILIRNILHQSTAFILFYWWKMEETDIERLSLFLRITWLIQKYTCDERLRYKLSNFHWEVDNGWLAFGADAADKILEVFEYSTVKDKKASDIIYEFSNITEKAWEDDRNQVEELLSALKEEIEQYKDEDVAAILVDGKDGIRSLQSNSTVLRLPFIPSTMWEVDMGPDYDRRAIPNSVKYTFLKDYNVYGNDVDLHGVFLENSFDDDTSSWVIEVYSDLLNGGGAERFAANTSYHELIAGEHIEQTEEYEEDEEAHMCDYFPSDTNFHPYGEALNNTALYQLVHNALYKIFFIKSRMALLLENCYWINNYLMSREEAEYDNISIDTLMSTLCNYVYGIPTGRKIRKYFNATVDLPVEVKKLYQEDIGFSKIKEAIAILRSILPRTIDRDGIREALNTWSNMYSNFLLVSGDARADELIAIMYDEVLTGISEALSRISVQSNELDTVCESTNDLFDNISSHFDNLYQNIPDKDILKADMIHNTQSFLADAETLYSMFVPNGNTEGTGELLHDYSAVALSYYRALEFLVNQLLYIPYKKRVLDCNTASLQGNSAIDYLGNSSGKIKVNGGCKPSLEMGTFAIFMGGLYLNYGNLHQSAEYPSMLNEFLSSNGVNISKLRSFCEKLFYVSKLRNECAHPELQNDSRAVKAKAVVYKHCTEDDSRINSINLALGTFEMINMLPGLWD